MRKLLLAMLVVGLAFTNLQAKDTKSKKTMASNSANLVTKIQKMLSALGYNPGPIDGKYGPLTKRAISVYQYDAMIDVDGRPSKWLLQQLSQDYNYYHYRGYDSPFSHGYHDFGRYSPREFGRSYHNDHSGYWDHWVRNKYWWPEHFQRFHRNMDQCGCKKKKKKKVKRKKKCCHTCCH